MKDSVRPRVCSCVLSVAFIYVGAITIPAVTTDVVAIITIFIFKANNAIEDK